MKHIAMLAVGGTIAGKGSAGKTTEYKPGKVEISDLIKAVPGIEKLADIEGIQFLNTASDNVTGKNLIDLANKINELSEGDRFDGFVVTHGTDTMEETAYFLNLTVKTKKPVVLVGSMRPSTATSADGPLNLYEAVALASCDEAYGKGVLIAFADAIVGAREAQKVNSFRTDAFNGRDFGILGYIRDENVHFINESSKKHTADSEFDVSGLESLPKVGIAYFHLDADPKILDCVYKNSDGIVIASAGNGGMSKAWGDKLKGKKDKPKPIVISTRISNGYTSTRSTSPAQFVAAGTLNPQKARILLQLALTKTDNIDEIKRIFEAY